MTATVAEVILDVQDIMGEVAGAGVQTYSEDRQLRDVVRAFNMIFKKYPWPQYCTWIRDLLDGTTGLLTTTALADVLDIEDIIAVHFDASPAMVPKLGSRSPYLLSTTQTKISGWASLHASHAQYADRKLQFYPVTSTDYVNIYARLYPIPVGEDGKRTWVPDDVMYFDKDMLAYGAAFFGLSNDGLNAEAAKTNMDLMEMRFQDIMAGLASQPIAIEGTPGIPQDWYESR